MRVGLLVTIVLLIRRQHLWYQSQQTGRDVAAVSLQQIRRFYPTAAQLADWDPEHGGRRVVDAAGQPLGYFVQTSPQSDRIVGYSGPTNTLIALDGNGHVLGMEILSSGDTREHVADVQHDEQFMTSLVGSTWDEASAKTRDVDAVSGATLTSLAIAEGINHRLGGAQPSSRFPKRLALDQIKTFFPSAAKLQARPDQPSITDIVDVSGQRLGAAIRTSPAADAVMGYQGPTDTLIVLGPDDRVRDLAIRGSFDNEPYVGYVRDDEYWDEAFHGLSLAELAAIDPKQVEVEGVSGATMTSMAIAYGLPKAAAAAGTIRRPPRRKIVLAARDFGTVAVLVCALLICFARLRRLRTMRIVFLLTLVAYLGFVNGDMISQALLVGWAQSGVPWRLAPGLVLLTVAALAVPVVSKKQLYCHHVCPFGAAQQLALRRLPWHWHPPHWLARGLRAVPAALLVLVVATAMWHWPVNLAGIEPFDAFFFDIAGWATLAVAAVGLTASLLVPMAYCRFGCPTGSVLNYLRFSGGSDRVSWRDAVALVLLLLAIVAGWR